MCSTSLESVMNQQHFLRSFTKLGRKLILFLPILSEAFLTGLRVRHDEAHGRGSERRQWFWRRLWWWIRSHRKFRRRRIHKNAWLSTSCWNGWVFPQNNGRATMKKMTDFMTGFKTTSVWQIPTARVNRVGKNKQKRNSHTKSLKRLKKTRSKIPQL